jgi:kynurenine formamidase
MQDSRVIDLSHPVHDGMSVYPGLPPPRIGLHLDHNASRPYYAGQAEFAIGRFDLIGNVGTYLDSPLHRYPDGDDVSQIPLERLVDRPTVVVDAGEAADRDRRLELVLPPGSLTGRAVLFRTGWDRYWGTDAYWRPGPFLGEATLEQLVHHRPAFVGVDFWNVDDPDDPTRPAHTALLGAGIPIVEHLRRLSSVTRSARISVVPLAIVGAPSAPVRAFALIPRSGVAASDR